MTENVNGEKRIITENDAVMVYAAITIVYSVVVIVTEEANTKKAWKGTRK